MLSSITPLGERGRGSRWGVTVACFVLAAALAGAAVGWLAGLLGSALLAGTSGDARLAILAAAIVAGIALDLGIGGARLPTLRRQVNENWLGAYRGWLYGSGFGLQLGAGAATIVTTSAVYLTFLAALLSASATAGLVIGATFGLLRGGAILTTARVRTPQRLFELNARVQERAGLSARLAPAALALALLWSVLAAVGG